MNYKLMRSVFLEMAKHEIIGERIPKADMIQQMQDPKNLLEFLRLFADAIGIGNLTCVGTIGDCEKCTPTLKQCPRVYLKNLSPKKYCILLTQKMAPSHISRTILPGEFTREQAELILKAYDNPDYILEEVKER